MKRRSVTCALLKKVLRRLPVAELLEQRGARRRVEIVRTQLPRQADRLAKLLDVVGAAAAATEVLVEATPVLLGETSVEVLGDELHELVAVQVVAHRR